MGAGKWRAGWEQVAESTQIEREVKLILCTDKHDLMNQNF